MPAQSRGPARGPTAVYTTTTVPAAVPLLVAEADELLRATLRDLFVEEGYAVLEAADGRAALELLRASREGVAVVLDHVLPLLSGEEVLYAVAKDRRLRRRHAFVLVSAAHLSRRLALMRLLDRLAIARIDEPFELDPLLDAVAQATSRVRRAP
jgi:CheY-like chemotaxis protein